MSKAGGPKGGIAQVESLKAADGIASLKLSHCELRHPKKSQTGQTERQQESMNHLRRLLRAFEWISIGRQFIKEAERETASELA